MKYIKKPLEIEAIKFTGDQCAVNEFIQGDVPFNFGVDKDGDCTECFISTLEGVMTVNLGDYIIKGIKGEFYPCKADIFKETYLPSGEIENISDGYHTFKELYEHRITLYIALARVLIKQGLTNVWRSEKHSDGSIWDKWFILGINQDTGKQITYHLPIAQWKETEFAMTVDRAPEFDGHSSSDVLQRLKGL